MDREKAFYWALGCWGGVLILCLVFSLVINKDWDVPSTFTRGDQCEALHKASLVLEPQNAWSNFGYLFVGLFIVFRAHTLFGKFLGGVLCALFLFSGLYHAAPVAESLQFLDVTSIYWVMMATIAYAGYGLLNRSGKLEMTVGGLIGMGGILLAGIVMALTRTKIVIFDSTWAVLEMGLILLILLFVGFISSSRVQPLTDKEKALYLLTIAAATGFSAMFRLLDGLASGRPKPLCYPDGMLGFLQAHAVWHVLSAAALLITYDYFSRVAGDRSRIFAD